MENETHFLAAQTHITCTDEAPFPDVEQPEQEQEEEQQVNPAREKGEENSGIDWGGLWASAKGAVAAVGEFASEVINSDAVQYGYGVATGLGLNLAYDIKAVNNENPYDELSDSAKGGYNLGNNIGKILLDVGQIALGTIGAIAGLGGEGLGLALDFSGVGTVIGVPVNALSAVIVSTGALVAGDGTVNLMKDLNRLFAESEGASKARYGERQISDEEYKSLREDTPTQEIRDKVNEGHDKTAVTNDEALPGKTFTGALEADHIVPMDKITKMDVFGKLTREQQLEVLNNEENFTGLSKSANTSKQSKSYEEWTHYKKGKPGEVEVNPEFRNEMIEKERELEGKLQKQIDDLNE
jgi:hypothetical protein